MSFTHTPSARSSCYRPLAFRYTESTSATVEKLLVEVAIYGDTYSFRKDWKTRTGTTASYTYTFDFDVQGVLQSYLAPSPDTQSFLFGALDDFSGVTNSDMFAPYSVTVYPETRNGDGFLETSTAGTTSSGYAAYSITRANEDAMGLGEFIYNGGNTIKFLTNAPSAVDIGYNESAFLTWISFGINAIQFIFYDANGTPTLQRSVDISGAAGNYDMVTIGVGPRQLENGSFSYHAPSPTMPTDLSVYSYYTVTVGSGTGVLSEVRRFNLVDRCSYAKRFYWLNRLGGCDQYTFEGEIKDVAKVSSETRQRQLPWDVTASVKHYPYYKGPFKGDIQSQRYLRIREQVPAEVGFWLREMLTSPEIYLESNDTFVNVVVEDVQQELESTGQYKTEFNLDILVEDEFVHRY